MLSYIFPNKCASCGAIISEGLRVCDECSKGLCRINSVVCKYCGRDILHCTCCRRKNSFSRNVSVFRYDESASNIVKRFKMGKITQLSVYISEEMSMLIDKEYRDIDFDCMTFVPSTRISVIRRGFDHTRMLADEISKRVGIPVQKLLKRRFSLKEQKSLSALQREQNVRNKYTALRDITYKRVLLIDDIITTGSTLNECARALKQAGVKEVFCATFAATYKK